MLITNRKDIIPDFEPIELHQMNDVKLMDRVDLKYTVPTDILITLLQEMKENYRILTIQSSVLHPYSTTYYDTPSHEMYYAHHNKQATRCKIRKREYLVSDDHFLEIKQKTNKGRTIKNRVAVPSGEAFSPLAVDLIKNYTDFDYNELVPKLKSKFNRMTLVNRHAPERVTIDVDISFQNETNEIDLPSISVIEIKRKKISNTSDFVSMMRKHRLRPLRISKYCIGLAMLDDSLKSNRFKKKLLAINKISKND